MFALSFLLILLVWELLPLRPRPTRVKILASIGLSVLLVLTLYIVLNRKARRLPRFDENYFSAMADACKGIGVKEAADYTQGVGIHKVGSIPQYLYYMPYDWIPDSLSTTELVLCVNEEKILVESCEYRPFGTFERFQNSRKAFLVVAKTGEVIAQQQFYGGPPTKCPREMSEDNGSYIGSAVREKAMLDWMRPYIEH
jgi:hypothetical protein